VSDALVRPLVPGEEAEVARLTVAAYTAEGLLIPGDPYATQLADVESRVRGAEVWVAELDGRIVGTVTWCPPGSAYREVSTADDQAEFRMLAVDPSVQRRGVARALVGLGGLTELGDHGGRDQSRFIKRLEEPRRAVVVGVCGPGGGDDDVGVEEDHSWPKPRRR